MSKKKINVIQEALKLYEGSDLFRDANKTSYIYTPVGDTLAIHGAGFENELKARFYNIHNRLLTEQHVKTVTGILSARAYDSPIQAVYLRVAEKDGVVCLDLANSAREVIEASAAGWKLSKGVRIPFRRPGGFAALIPPQNAWEGWTLRDYLASLFPGLRESALLAIAGFLLGALRQRGPFPLLQFIGGKGTLKSTTARKIKALIDPDSGDERGFPRNEQDFAIHAHNCWIVLFGNISIVPQWLSDSLCRLATGGAFGTRKLYKNDEESVIRLNRPCIITGIGDVVERSDLKDRILFVELPEVDERDRKTEAEVWDEFREFQPHTLGALLDCLCAGLANLDAVKPERLHRMADWHKFMIAAFPAMGFEDGLLDQMLDDNRNNATESVIENSFLAQTLIGLMANKTEYETTATKLHHELRDWAQDRPLFDPKNWPANPQVLSTELRCLESDLRRRGIWIEFPRHGQRRSIIIRRDANDAVKTSASPSAS